MPDRQTQNVLTTLWLDYDVVQPKQWYSDVHAKTPKLQHCSKVASIFDRSSTHVAQWVLY